MSMLTRRVWSRTGFALVLAALAVLPAIDAAYVSLACAAAPDGQSYIGTKECASCHFDQYMKWKKDKHSKEAFTVLTPQYQADPACLKCHTTGYGQPTGYQGAATPNLIGVTCEACHGTGSKHAEIAKQYANKKQLSEDEKKLVNGAIFRVLPKNVCIECHTSKAHKDHPKYTK